MRLATRLEGDPNLAALVYALVRALRPRVVVETGVAKGITSAYILAALSDNGIGMLHSIDLPPTALVMAQLVGAAIPNNLRKQWTYYWGSARRLLPSVLRRAHPVSLFIHDSDHSYDNMRWELEQAWRVLEPGGCLVADDVNLHTAFGDMATAVGAQPVYVKQTGRKSGAIGLLWKSE
jgi:predicted O-methyltransferase YrrM